MLLFDSFHVRLVANVFLHQTLVLEPHARVHPTFCHERVNIVSLCFILKFV